jgi:hypothetical protein
MSIAQVLVGKAVKSPFFLPQRPECGKDSWGPRGHRAHRGGFVRPRRGDSRYYAVHVNLVGGHACVEGVPPSNRGQDARDTLIMPTILRWTAYYRCCRYALSSVLQKSAAFPVSNGRRGAGIPAGILQSGKRNQSPAERCTPAALAERDACRRSSRDTPINASSASLSTKGQKDGGRTPPYTPSIQKWWAEARDTAWSSAFRRVKTA